VSNKSIMPIRSDRENQLKDLKSLILLSVLLEDSISDSSSKSNSSSSDGESDAEEIVGLSELYLIGNEIRYFQHREYFSKSKDFYYNFFRDFPGDFFQTLVRMEKASSWNKVSLIELDPIFHNCSPRQQFPVALQLAVTLDRLGHYGNGNSLKRTTTQWGIAIGLIVKFMSQCMKFIKVALKDYVRWPNEAA
jgi:hypothetical protein